MHIHVPLCARAHTHTHTHIQARCYQDKGRIMGTEDGDSHLETILTNIDQHHQQIRLVLNIESLQLWAFSLAWHLFNLIDPLPKMGKKWESEDVPPTPTADQGTSPSPRCPVGTTNIEKCTNFQLKMMNWWTQALRSALFKNSTKATKGDLATTKHRLKRTNRRKSNNKILKDGTSEIYLTEN